jgi:hypothetical protein
MNPMPPVTKIVPLKLAMLASRQCKTDNRQRKTDH